MKLIDKDAVLEYFAAPGPEELKEWCQERGFDVDPTRDFGPDVPSDHVLAAALWHVNKHLGVDEPDVCGYAGLVAHLATVPETVAKGMPTAEFTRRVLRFLDTFCFGDQEQAVVDLLNSIGDRATARIVLGLALLLAEYHHLAEVADGFLKKKENISALRKVVREVLKK